MADGESRKNADLPVRVVSAIVMVAIAGTALWLGGWVWTAFVALVALGVLWEWWGLAAAITHTPIARFSALFLGAIYILSAVFVLIASRLDSLLEAMLPIVAVVAVDIGAYFSGRTFGGPKIAPSISPSKTWSGLIGGAVAASAFFLTIYFSGQLEGQFSVSPANLLACGIIVAIIAQAGDFLESWIKRKADVKDSSKLIPGHGGLLDRVDGLLAVMFMLFLINIPYMLSSNYWPNIKALSVQLGVGG
jgi:phosphatidate cytidylyltransferase